MKAIAKTKRREGLDLIDKPVPEIGPGDALIRIRAAGVCGTDVHIYNWDKWSQARIHPPLVAGHEFVGTIEKCGSEVHHVKPGDRVSGEGHLVCGHCTFCRTGQAHICRDVEIIGVDRDGCFAEMLAMPADNLWPVPDQIPDHHAAVFDPLGNAMHTVMSAPIAGRSVLVMGAGAIGLFAISILKTIGAARIIVVEPDPYRRELAAKLDIDTVLDPSDDDVDETVLKMTDGLGTEVLLEMSGHESAIKQGLRLLRNGGDAAMLGIPPGPITIDWAEVVFKGITIHAVNGRRMYDTWYQSQAFLLKSQLTIDPIITHIIDFNDYQQAFDLLRSGNAGKIVLRVAE